MPLLELFESTGNWLFRWRSYLPLIFTVLVLGGLSSFEYPYGSHRLDQLWEVFCLSISLTGLLVRALTVGYTAGHTSGRNTDRQIADTLNTTGMYSIVRNPLYLGNFLIVLGVVTFLRTWWLSLLYVMLFTLYYERIIFAEEMFLRRRFGQAYLDWATKTPAFLPRLRKWISPTVPISVRKILYREYHGAFGLIAAFFLLETAGDIVQGYEFNVDLMWRYIIVCSFAGYVAIRYLHKRTTFFKGR